MYRNCAVYVCHTSIFMIYIYIHKGSCLHVIYIFFVHIHIHVYMRSMHHICMYPYIHICTYQFYTPIHTVYMQFHIWHMFDHIFSEKTVVASTVTSPAKQLGFTFLMGVSSPQMWRLWNEYPKFQSQFHWILLDFFRLNNSRTKILKWTNFSSYPFLSYPHLFQFSIYLEPKLPVANITIDTWFWP